MEKDTSNTRDISDTLFQHSIDVGQSFYLANTYHEVLPNLDDLKNLPQRREAIADDKGYMYSIDKTVNGIRYLHCSRKNFGCLARAIWRANGELEPQTCHTHNHIPDLRRLGVRRFTAAFIDEVVERKGVSLKQIYLDLAAKYQADASYVTYKQACRALKRAKMSAAIQKNRTLTYSVGKMAKLPNSETVNFTDFQLEEESSNNSVTLVGSEVVGSNNSKFHHFMDIEDKVDDFEYTNYDSEPDDMNLTCELPEDYKNLSLLDLEALSNLPQRRNAIADDQGYTYVLNRTTKNARYLRCSQRAAKGCLARAILRADGILEPQDSQPHNHEPNIIKIAVKRFNTAFILEAINRKGRTLKEVYNDTLTKHPEEAPFATFASAHKAFKRAEQTSVTARSKNADVAWNSFKIAGVRRPNCRKFIRNWNNTPTSSEDIQTKEDRNDSHDLMDDVKEELDDTIRQEEQPVADNEDTVPVSELLPGPKGKPMYYDGTGYYYNQTSEDDMYRWLECLHSECDITARMERHKGAPITLLPPSTAHSHRPNPERRERICFLQRIKERHATEDTPFTIIFQEESLKNPIGASFFSFEKIEKHVMKKITQDGTNRIEITPKVQPTITTRSGRISTMKTRARGSRPISPLEEPESKKRKISKITKPSTTHLSKKLELLKSLKDLNSSSTTPKEDSQPSERLPGPDPHSFVYHDGSGYYYKALCVSKNKRQLKCTTAGCPAQAVMGLELKSPIQLDDEILSHNHPPKPLTSSDPERKGIDKTTSERTPLTAAPLGTNLHEDRNDLEALSEKVPALLSDSWLYHDCNGFYYSSKHIHLDKRFVECVVPRCGVQGWMSLRPGAAIKTSKPHSHGPQGKQQRDELWFIHRVKARVLKERDTPFTLIYTKEANENPEGAALISEDEIRQLLDKLINEQNLASVKLKKKKSMMTVSRQPAEKLPSPMFGSSWHYHDGKGYYYILDKNLKASDVNIMYMKCVWSDWWGCQGRASMLAEGKGHLVMRAPHNHEPDPLHRQLCLFSYALKQRARDENTSLRHIYAEEAKKFPAAAASMKESKVMEKLIKIRKLVKSQIDIPAEEDEGEHIESHTEKQKWKSVSEKLQGRYKPVYHDGKGYYYLETFCSSTFRFLMCIEPQCVAQARMGLDAGSPVLLLAGSYAHTHESDMLRRSLLLFLDTLRHRTRTELKIGLDTIYMEEYHKEPVIAGQIGKDTLLRILSTIRNSEEMGIDTKAPQNDTENQVEEEDLWAVEAVERLPSHEHRGWLYHDGIGHYYYCHHLHQPFNRMTLRCLEEKCQAEAWLSAGTIVRVSGSVLHNHRPDPLRRAQLLLLHRVITRVHLTHLPPEKVFQQEADRDPEAAALLPQHKIQEVLHCASVDKYFKFQEDIDFEDVPSPNDNKSDDDYNSLGRTQICETICSASSGKPVYCIEEGFYYREIRQTNDKLYLVCLKPMCKARATIHLPDTSAIHVPESSLEHDHEPDLFYRNKLIFLQNLRHRVLTETTPINTIYNDEANREPIGADVTNDVTVMNFMYKLRKANSFKINLEDCNITEIGYHPDKGGDDIGDSVVRLENMDKEEVITEVDLYTSSAYSNNCEEYAEDEYFDEAISPQIPSNSKSKDGKSNRLGVNDKSSGQYLPTEILPTRSHNVLYHNGEGYYFHSNAVRGKIMYLRCAESKCKNRGWKSMERDDAPIMPTSSSRPHNHQPDFTHREQLLLVHRCKLRAAAENRSIHQIWEDEVARDPETASKVSPINVKTQMRRYRLDHAEYSPKNPSIADVNSSVDLNERNYFQTQDIHEDVVPEKIPSLTDDTLWHAAGYFYTTQKTINNLVKVKCTEKGCNAVGQITLKEGIPEKICMNWNSVHSHPADPHRRDQLVFIDRCKRRAADSFETIQDIYDDESNKEPEVAAQLSAGRVKRAMMEAKKIHMEKFNYTIDEDETFEDFSEEHLLSEQDEQDALAEVKDGTSVANENSDELPKDSVGCIDQKYSDIVTLEDGESDQESINSTDEGGADFTRLPEISEDNDKEFHDGNGYYYNLVTKDKDTRWLACKAAKCGVRVSVAAEEKPLLKLFSASPSHDHPPDQLRRRRNLFLKSAASMAQSRDPVSTENILKKNLVQSKSNLGSDRVESKQMSEQEESNEMKQSEALPGMRPGSSVYHDLNGYYFVFNVLRENKRYVRCIEPKCRVRGSMGLYDGAPILTSGKTVHNHQPDFKRKNYLKFFQQCKERAFNEPDKPIMEIFAEEKQKDPVSAAVPGSRNIVKNMARIRKSLTKFTPTEEDHSEFVDAFLSTSLSPQSSSELNENNSSSQIVKSSEFECFGTENNISVMEEVPSETPQETTFVAELEEASQLTCQNETLEDSLGNGNTVYWYQPSNTTHDRPTFYDDKGYSYHQTTIRQGIRFLRCGEANCKARASMKVELNSPVTMSKQSPQHNHQPIQSEFTMLLDPSQLVDTADDSALRFVFADPLGGEQVAVCQIPDETTPSKRVYKPRQTPEITINTEEPVQTEVQSDVDVAAGDYYHNEDQQKYPLKPSEVVPGLRPDANNYHDGNGFYYELNRLSQNIRYLKCLMKDCKARAYMEVGRLNAPIIQTNYAKHTHGPDLFRKRFTVFLHRVTRRAAEEDTPINTIYDQEAKRDPESANHIRPGNVKQRMMRCRKKYKQIRETSLGNEIDTADIYHFFLEDNLENQDKVSSEEIQPKEEYNEEEKKYKKEVDESSLFQDYVISEVEVESCSQLQNA